MLLRWDLEVVVTFPGPGVIPEDIRDSAVPYWILAFRLPASMDLFLKFKSPVTSASLQAQPGDL